MVVCGFGIGKGQLFYTSAELDIYLTFSVEAFQPFQGLGYKFCITLNLIFYNYYFSENRSFWAKKIRVNQIDSNIYLSSQSHTNMKAWRINLIESKSKTLDSKIALLHCIGKIELVSSQFFCNFFNLDVEM